MAAAAQALGKLDARQLPDGLATIPSPAKVRAIAAEIRQSWTPRERRRRAQAARYMLVQQLVAGAGMIGPADRDAGFQLTPRFPPSRS